MSLEVDQSPPSSHFAMAAPQPQPPREVRLSTGVLEAIYNGQKLDFYPILQVLVFKPHVPQDVNAQPRFRLSISDGSHTSIAVASTAMNPLIEKELQRHCTIELTSYNLSASKDKKFIVLSSFTIHSPPIPKVGNPVSFESPAPGAAPAPAPAHTAKLPAPHQQRQPPQAASPAPAQAVQAPAGRAPAPVAVAAPAPAPAPHHHHQQQQKPQAQAARPAPPAAVYHQQQQQQAPPIGDTPVNITLIEGLNPYQPRWVLKVRIMAKSPIKSWSNARGQGRLFSMDLVDQSGEIRAVGFSDAVDRFYDHLQVGGVYLISRGHIKSSDPRFSNIKNPYEMTIDPNTQIVPVEQNEAADVPLINPNIELVQLREIEALEPGKMIDVMAVVVEVGELTAIKTKKGDMAQKRDLVLMDATNTTIRLTLWGKTAEEFDGEGHPVYIFKSLRISDFGGRSLSSNATSAFFKDPDAQEVEDLRRWYEESGRTATPRALSSLAPSGASAMNLDADRVTLQTVRDLGLGQREGQVDEFYTKASILMIPSEGNIAYTACPGEGCSKKVVQDAPGQWHCEKCQKIYPEAKHRYTLSVSIADFTGQLWTRCFDSVGATLLGHPADNVVEWQSNQDPSYPIVFSDANFRQYVFRCRAKMEKYDETLKANFQLTNAMPVHYVNDSRKLLAEIAALSASS